MKKKTGTVTNVQRKSGDNGKYLVVSIDGQRFSVFGSELFEEFQEGNTVNVQYTEKEKGGNVYRNIQKAGTASESGQTNQTGSPNLNLKAQALHSACIFANAVDKEISSEDVLKVSKKFHQYLMED